MQRQNGIGRKYGIYAFNQFLRRHLQDWRMECLERHDYVCFVTETKYSAIDIHHSKPFHVIRNEVLAELGLSLRRRNIRRWSPQTLARVVDKFKERHQGIAGIPLNRQIHELFHNLYGVETTMDQLIEFKQRYNTGEFADKLGQTEAQNER